MLQFVKKWLLIFAAIILTACSAGPGSESTGEFIDSSAATARIKASLVDKLGPKAFAIQVKTFKEEVQLSGFVSSTYVKNRAGSIAATGPGIRRVRNDLVVKY